MLSFILTALCGGFWAEAARSGAPETQTKPAPLIEPKSVSPAVEAARGVEEFGDWKRVCETPPGGRESVCFVFQKVNFAETNAMLLQAVIGYFRADITDPVLILTVPLGTFLPPGIEVRIAGSAPIHDHFEVCMAIGCQATMRLDAKMIATLSGAAEAEILVKDGAKKQVSIPLSLKGLAKAVASLKPRPKG